MPTDHANTWAAVVTYWHQDVFGYRSIICKNTEEDYVKEVSAALCKSIESLVEHYYGYVNAGDLYLLDETFGDGESDPESEDEWTASDVIELLKQGPALALKEYLESGSAMVSKARWYRNLIEFLNDLFPDGSGVFIHVEGPLPTFLPQLLEFEAVGRGRLSQIPDSKAIWLGKLAALIHRTWNESVAEDHWLVVHSLFSAFDERNSQIYS